jgi:signal transduction histidine kinase
MSMRRAIGLRLALWYAGVFITSAIVLVALTYALLASSLRQRDQQIVASTLRDYAARYEAGGLPALVSAIEAEQRTGSREQLFVRVLGPGRDALFLTMPRAYARFDLDRLETDEDGIRAEPARDRTAVLEVATARLPDGTVLQVGKSSENREQLLERFRRVMLLVSVLIILAGLAGGAVVTHSTLQPLRALAAAVTRIAATGRTETRVPVPDTNDAMEDLSRSFNTMLDRIDALMTAMRDSFDNVAHDLRTPMTRLRGLAERALADGSPAVTREALADCLEEAERMQAMLDTLMDISEAETGALRLAMSDVAVAPLAEEVRALYEDVAEDKSIRLEGHAPPDLIVRADRDRLRQALANLVDNAVKYTPAGGRVSITAAREDGGSAIRVADTGIGLAPGERERIFDRLYRGDRSRSERGLGLGLSLVRAYVQAHHGRVTVEDNGERGSVFTIWLPHE